MHRLCFCFCWLILPGLLSACVTSYDPSLRLSSDLLIVNGILTDQAEPQTITLSRTQANADSAVSRPVAKAQVEVLVNGSTILALSETLPGTYQLPDGFRGQVGQTYQLRFRLAGGDTYASSVETMTSVPPIGRAYDQLNPKRVAVGDTNVPASDVFIDYEDPAGQANFYLWRWRLYEYQDWCATCRQGRYVVQDVGPPGNGQIRVLGCLPDSTTRSYVSYDYACRSQCWDIFYSTRIDAFSDIYTNGRAQAGHKIATIPVYQARPALILIEQLSLSPNAYRYYKLFADQVQNTGTLADSPPAPIAGNVKNQLNPLENVIGYFSAASVAVYRHKITRQNLPFSQFIGLFRAQNRRKPNRETERLLGGIFGYNIPSALCIPGRTRTDQFPPGWNQ